jgi:Regulator of Chromosome Condensation (RCC1) repeat protein
MLSRSSILGTLLAAACFPLAAQQSLSEAKDGTYYLYGTIGRTLEVELTLAKKGKELEGSYVYANHQQPIALKGAVTKPYEYELDEAGPDGAVTGHFKLSELSGGPGAPIGTWEGGERKKKLTVVLSEIQSEQHQLLRKIWGSKLPITSLVAGFDHACALRSFGALCWGDVPLMPGIAIAGPEMIAYRALPNLLVDDKVAGFASGYHRLCIVQSGSLRCWQPYDPQLPLREPTLIPGFERSVTAIGASQTQICAVVGGALRCWNGASLSSESITQIIPAGVTGLSSGDPQCAIMSGGGLKCWSMEYQPQEKSSKLVVQDVVGLKGEIRSLSATGADAQHFACGVDSEGLKCWGNNFGGVIGKRPGNAVRNLPPAPIAGLETGVSFVATNLDHSCAIKEGKVYCWGGLNSVGQLGDGSAKFVEGIVEVKGVESATQVAVGPRYSCALTASGRIWCWGGNEFGETGSGSHDVCIEPQRAGDPIRTPCNLHPAQVRGLD